MPTPTVAGRDVATQQVARHFGVTDHLRDDLKAVSEIFADAAQKLIATVPDGPELIVALRHLLTAKDAGVRAAVDS